MALARRNTQRFSGHIWPGFVDALTALLLILMFVLSIFMIVQFSLRERITGQDQKLQELDQELTASQNRVSTLTTQLANLSSALGLEQQRSAELESQVGSLQSTLENERTEVSRLEAALALMTQQREAADAEVARLSGELETSLTEAEALNTALVAARTEIDEQAEAARLAAARREALEAMVAQLETDQTAREAELAALTSLQEETLALLTALREKDAANEARLAELTAEQALALATLADLEQERDALKAEQEASATSQAQLRLDLEAALARVTELGSELSEAEKARLAEIAAAEALREKLASSTVELDAATLALDQARREAEETLTLLAAAEAAREQLLADVTANTDAFDREAALRAVAEQELSKAKEQTLEEQRKVAALNAQIRELNEQLGSLQALLDSSAARDEQAQVQIAELSSQLNQALAQKVSELSRFRSEFFGKMREVLGRREGVRVVGDRFVFQSEVLFPSASATLQTAGLAELQQLAEVIRDVSAGAPQELNWVLRVDGHTDRIPLSGSGRFRDNWELSQARALSVVRYLIDVEGIPPERLAATGFGEWQPIDSGSSAEALARNRRIEFKFTER
jgi:chemotaxis protein MotB